jgi:hypothetical protein
MPYYDGEEFTSKKVLSGIIIWFLSGIIFGKIVHSRNIKQSSKDDN